MENTEEKTPFQPDIDLCAKTPKCWRFEKKAPICWNCPHIKISARTQHINEVNTLRVQNKLH